MSVGRFCMLLSGCDVPRLFLYIPLVAYPGSFDSGTVYVARASLRQTRNRRNTQLLHNTHTTKRSKDFVPVYFQHPFKVQVQDCSIWEGILTVPFIYQILGGWAACALDSRLYVTCSGLE